MELREIELQLQEFHSIAIDARQDIEKLSKGESQITYFRIETMKEARRILSQATPDERKKRSITFLDGLEYRCRIPQGMHDRGEAYVFANHPLEDGRDHNGHRNHLPIYVRTWSIPEKVVGSGEVWDITLKPQDWKVDELEEMYSIVNVGRLVLEENASVIVRGNALIFTCQELIKKGALIKEYDIGILGTPHGFGFRKGKFNGEQGNNGKDGLQREDGIKPHVGANFLGKLLHPSFIPETMDGNPGSNGENGSDGEDGLNGGACRIAELNIRSIKASQPLVIGVISGDGGNSGDGGTGGNGGNGGNGVEAIKTIEGIVGPGKGGSGGNGGHGGHGGRAGHGGISSNVFINVPESAVNLIRYFSKAGQPGKPGKGGLPGNGGIGGYFGKNLNNESSDKWKRENGGISCKRGRDGREGRGMPAAKIYINNEMKTSEWKF